MRREVSARVMDLFGAIAWGDPVRTFQYRSERFRHWDACPAQPALMVVAGNERRTQKSGMPPIRDLEFRLVTYHQVGLDTSVARPADENDLLMDAFDRLLLGSLTPDGRQTLGGLVHHARFEGDILKDPGDDDGQAMMYLPLWCMIP